MSGSIVLTLDRPAIGLAEERRQLLRRYRASLLSELRSIDALLADPATPAPHISESAS
jgi:hypothetical protein